MTIQQLPQSTTNEHAVEEPTVDGEVEPLDLITSALRNNMLQEREQADQYAADAHRLHTEAEALEDRAMACRARQRRWERLLKLDAAGDELIGELVNDEGDAQTTLIPRQRRMYPLVHPDGSNTPFLACVNCGKPVREATAGEVETVLAGGDVQPRCNDCTPGGKDGHPYPPVPPQDAA